MQNKVLTTDRFKLSFVGMWSCTNGLLPGERVLNMGK